MPTVFISGANRDIGLELARQLRGQAIDVLINCTRLRARRCERSQKVGLPDE
jgi:NAD(P)-dependent dehydrogenase (short-subunit alcohol dehydrogenase family)